MLKGNVGKQIFKVMIQIKNKANRGGKKISDPGKRTTFFHLVPIVFWFFVFNRK